MPAIKELGKRVVHPLRYARTRAHRRAVAGQTRLATGHKRVYFYHIRKTAGTSLHMAFLGIAGNGHDLNEALHHQNHWIEAGGRIYVRAIRHLIEEGFYFEGGSHIPAHRLTLPPDTFRLTVLRDPVERVLSHYRMLVHYRETEPGRAGQEMGWLGRDLGEFLDNIPREHLHRQLFMFSKRFDPAEAAAFINDLEFVMHQSSFDDDLLRLGERLSLPLKSYRAKRYRPEFQIDERELDRLREMMAPEDDMLRLLSAPEAR